MRWWSPLMAHSSASGARCRATWCPQYSCFVAATLARRGANPTRDSCRRRANRRFDHANGRGPRYRRSACTERRSDRARRRRRHAARQACRNGRGNDRGHACRRAGGTRPPCAPAATGRHLCEQARKAGDASRLVAAGSGVGAGGARVPAVAWRGDVARWRASQGLARSCDLRPRHTGRIAVEQRCRPGSGRGQGRARDHGIAALRRPAARRRRVPPRASARARSALRVKPAAALAQALREAARMVARVAVGRSLADELDRMAEEGSETPRSALIDLTHGTLRRYGRVQALVGELSRRGRPDALVEALLWCSLYALESGRYAEYTVVDQAVRACALLERWSAKGYVNALLRGFLRERAALEAQLANQPQAAHQHPAWWIDLVRKAYPQTWPAVLAAGNTHPPMALRV